MGCLKEFQKINIDPQFISALTGEGVPELAAGIAEALEGATEREEKEEEAPLKVFKPAPRREGVSVRREGDVFVVQSPGLERIIEGSDTTDLEARRQLLHQVGRTTVARALQKAGVKQGDRIRCGSFEWRF